MLASITRSIGALVRSSDLKRHAVTRRGATALDISVAVSEKTAVVRAAGELDLATVPDLANVLEGLERECARIVLDLSGLTFIDSTGVRLTLIEHDRASIDGFEFAIAGVTGPVRDVLRRTGLDAALPLVPDVAAVHRGRPRAESTSA